MYSYSGMIKAYSDMVYARKQQYVSTILDMVDNEGEVTDESLHLLYVTLKEYVLLDLTYTKLIDIDRDRE